MSQVAVMESIRRMRKIRKLARMYPVDTLPKRLEALAQVARGEDGEKKPAAVAAPAPRRQARKGLDRMERGGETRGESEDGS